MPHKHSERNIFFLYEVAQVDAYERYLDAHPDVAREEHLVIPSSLQIEYALTKKGIPFRSGRAYRPKDISRFALAEEWNAAVFDSDEWKWFQYRRISLSQIFFLNVQDYILRLLYYGTILENILVGHPTVQRLIVFPSSHSLALENAAPSVTATRVQPLLRKLLRAVVACATLIGSARGIEVMVSEPPVRAPQAWHRRHIAAFKRVMMEGGITLYNIALTLAKPRGTPRILASDYWRNMAPIMSQLSRGELMLFDRSEVFKAGWKNVWRSRIRLFNFSSFSIRDRAKARAEAQQAFDEQWRTLRDQLPSYIYSSFSLRPLMFEMFEELITHVVPQTLCDIDGAYALLTRIAPDIVFLRASVSLQTHFDILAQVARACDIRSLELQHGLENLGPGSYSKRHSAEHIAVYGPAIQDEFVALGYPREKIPIVGSPRFDDYHRTANSTAAKATGKGLIMLCIGTLVGVESAEDEYLLEDYYMAIASALEKIPNSSVVIKLRPGSTHEQFYRSTIERIFARVPHTIVQYEPFSELFATTDAVVSYYSTTVLEALKFGKPTVVYSGEPREEAMTRYHFTRYAKAEALLIAYSQKELDKAFRLLVEDAALFTRVSERAAAVLEQLHAFDGKASERIIALIERLARGQSRRPSL